MNVLDYLFRARRKNSAALAKERLQIIVSHERGTRQGPDYLPMLQHELLQVIAKYVNVAPDQVKVELERSDHGAILELNVTLPDDDAKTRSV
jgi:cell division topological specificity factor